MDPVFASIIAACITGGLSLIGVTISVKASTKKTEQALQVGLEVMKTEVKQLRKEVEKHNNFATRIPALEALEQTNANAIKRLENFHME